MVQVFFEHGNFTELVAVFDNEMMYLACLPALNREAEKVGAKLIESMIDDKFIKELL
jgi:hypothetical protein